MIAVIPEITPEFIYMMYVLFSLPILVIGGFEVAEHVVARYEKRKAHTIMKPFLIGICLIWAFIGYFASAPLANHFQQNSFHSQLEDELEVTKLVEKNGEEIEACVKGLVDTKKFDVTWKERKTEHQGTLTLSPNGNDSCVYQLDKDASTDS